MLNYVDGAPFAVIAACLHTEAFCLATGGPLDPFPDIQSPPVRSQLRPFIQVGYHGYPHQVIRRNRSGQR
jgi:hypothetical protein